MQWRTQAGRDFGNFGIIGGAAELFQRLDEEIVRCVLHEKVGALPVGSLAKAAAVSVIGSDAMDALLTHPTARGSVLTRGDDPPSVGAERGAENTTRMGLQGRDFLARRHIPQERVERYKQF
jgi:hypothetical protein